MGAAVSSFSFSNVDVLIPFITIFIYMRLKSSFPKFDISTNLLHHLAIIVPSNSKISVSLNKLINIIGARNDPIRLDNALSKLEVSMITLHSVDSNHMIFINDYIKSQIFYDLFDNIVGLTVCCGIAYSLSCLYLMVVSVFTESSIQSNWAFALSSLLGLLSVHYVLYVAYLTGYRSREVYSSLVFAAVAFVVTCAVLVLQLDFVLFSSGSSGYSLPQLVLMVRHLKALLLQVSARFPQALLPVDDDALVALVVLRGAAAVSVFLLAVAAFIPAFRLSHCLLTMTSSKGRSFEQVSPSKPFIRWLLFTEVALPLILCVFYCDGFWRLCEGSLCLHSGIFDLKLFTQLTLTIAWIACRVLVLQPYVQSFLNASTRMVSIALMALAAGPQQPFDLAALHAKLKARSEYIAVFSLQFLAAPSLVIALAAALFRCCTCYDVSLSSISPNSSNSNSPLLALLQQLSSMSSGFVSSATLSSLSHRLIARQAAAAARNATAEAVAVAASPYFSDIIAAALSGRTNNINISSNSTIDNSSVAQLCLSFALKVSRLQLLPSEQCAVALLRMTLSVFFGLMFAASAASIAYWRHPSNATLFELTAGGLLSFQQEQQQQQSSPRAADANTSTTTTSSNTSNSSSSNSNSNSNSNNVSSKGDVSNNRKNVGAYKSKDD